VHRFEINGEIPRLGRFALGMDTVVHLIMNSKYPGQSPTPMLAFVALSGLRIP
jgi:hypothetical protein